MNVLILGSGGREHALAWKFNQSKDVKSVHVLPGNAGISAIAMCAFLPNYSNESIYHYAVANNIDLTIVGQELYLERGIVDYFQEKGLRIFGPTQKAAQIETSKAFSKELMKKYSIPTAKFDVFDNQLEAYTYACHLGFPVVLKADGLAQGKGVYIAYNEAELEEALTHLFADYGLIVVEMFLVGEEFSYMVMVHGDVFVELPLARDYKRISSDFHSLNTGGMGAYSGVSDITEQDKAYALEAIIKPTMQALKKEGCPYTGVLYAGLMKTKDGIYTIEFNARFGDPETEVVLPRINNDFFQVIINLLQGKATKLDICKEQTVGVVLANKGYPVKHETQMDIIIPKTDALLFHMGTSMSHGKVNATGGRVMIVVSKDNTIEAARAQTYKAIEALHLDFYFRDDIAKK